MLLHSDSTKLCHPVWCIQSHILWHDVTKDIVCSLVLEDCVFLFSSLEETIHMCVGDVVPL